jgi:hypothetical protein
MTSQMTTKSVDAALSEVARRGMLRVSFDVVKATALDVWYGSEVRDLTKLRGPYQKDVLFLVERLVYYNVVPQPRKKALLEESTNSRNWAKSVFAYAAVVCTDACPSRA